MTHKWTIITLLCLTQNFLFGIVEYYNPPAQATIQQKQMEALEARLFHREISIRYNNFTHPLINPKISQIRKQVLSGKIQSKDALLIYNDYAFDKLLNLINNNDDEVKKLLAKDPYVFLIKLCLVPYSSFYFMKLMGQPIDVCQSSFYKNRKNVIDCASIANVASEFLIYLSNSAVLNPIRYILSDIVFHKSTSCQIDFYQPNRIKFTLWEIFILHILNTLKSLEEDVFLEFVAFYNNNSTMGLLLTWEKFWDERQEKAICLKEKIKTENLTEHINELFYASIQTMPPLLNINNDLKQILECNFFLKLSNYFSNEKKQIKQLLTVFWCTHNFSLIDVLFHMGKLTYPAKIYLKHNIIPIYPDKLIDICFYFLLTEIKTQILSPFEISDLATFLMYANAYQEKEEAFKRINESVQKIKDKIKEEKEREEKLQQLLLEKKTQAAENKQQPKAKSQKTLNDLDITFGVSKPNVRCINSFKKTTITEKEYKNLLEQSCTTGNVMQHGSHATMRMTLKDENGETRQIQVQGYLKHGNALNRRDKGKKSYAILEKEYE